MAAAPTPFDPTNVQDGGQKGVVSYTFVDVLQADWPVVLSAWLPEEHVKLLTLPDR